MAHTQTLEQKKRLFGEFVGTKAFLLNVYTRWRRPLEKKPESLHLVCVCVCVLDSGVQMDKFFFLLPCSVQLNSVFFCRGLRFDLLLPHCSLVEKKNPFKLFSMNHGT